MEFLEELEELGVTPMAIPITAEMFRADYDALPPARGNVSCQIGVCDLGEWLTSRDLLQAAALQLAISRLGGQRVNGQLSHVQLCLG